MVCLIILVLATIISIEARIFNNPIISDKIYNSQGAIKVNGTYYVVARTDDISDGVFPIHTSTDLTDWKLAGHVFPGINTTTWARIDPVIHQVGENFLVYFAGRKTVSSYYEVNVAVADHPLGPYSAIDKPVSSLPNTDLRFPSIINDEDKLYLVWSSDLSEIKAQQLNTDGLSIPSEETVSLLKANHPWEDGSVYAPRYIRRENYHYLLYTGQLIYDKTSVGVARSSNGSLGPYKKLSQPIIVSSSSHTSIMDACIVKDLDEENDVIFFKGGGSVLLASLAWDSDDWPTVGDF